VAIWDEDTLNQALNTETEPNEDGKSPEDLAQNTSQKSLLDF